MERLIMEGNKLEEGRNRNVASPCRAGAVKATNVMSTRLRDIDPTLHTFDGEHGTPIAKTARCLLR